MTAALVLVDVVLIVALLLLAWSSLRAADIYASCILFITFGLVMALAWARLRAPDIALAEAAIGSGITGALLLAAVRRIAPAARQRNHREDRGQGGND